MSRAVRTLDQTSYLTQDNTTEHIHPCAYTFKIQTHKSDTPTYTDILQSTSEEHTMWDAAMIKELKSLRDIGSFNMVARPHGANILQST